MDFGLIALVVAIVVGSAVLVTGIVCLRWSWVKQTVDTLGERLVDVAPYVGFVAGALFIKQAAHGTSVQVSKALDWDITALIYQLEGSFVAEVQAITPAELVPVFSAVYIFGFGYLVVTPVVYYLIGPSRRALKELLVAYGLNASLGLVLYTLFIARGPRLYLGDAVDGLLFQLYPPVRNLTGAVSVTTNVFPSLHTSLSVIVLLVAWRTRETQPRWFQIAAVVASGVVLSTMVLGIHWLVDVLAGVCLAVGCVYGAGHVVTAIEARRRFSSFGPENTRHDGTDSEG